MLTQVKPQVNRSFFRYMPISRRMQEWGFAVTNAGYSITDPGVEYPPTRHPSHHHFTWETGRVLNTPSFIYITRGAGQFESASSAPTQVTEGHVLTLFPGEWHRYRPDPRTGWHEYWVDFAGPEAERLFSLAPFSPTNPVLSVGLDEELILAFTRLNELARTEPFRMELLLSAEAMCILCRVIALMETRQLGNPGDAAAISRAKASLLEDRNSNLDLVALARSLGMSYTTFRRIFKATTGFSPRHFQLEHRIHRAKAMLNHSTLPIGELSEALGFESQYYFSQFFKKKTGLSPTEFRKQARGNGRFPP